MITDHKFVSGCPPECEDDHSDFMCLYHIDGDRQCEKRASEHGIRPDTIEFNAAKGVLIEPCPRCGRDKWLGTCEDGSKMCQSCFHKLHGLAPLPSDSM